MTVAPVPLDDTSIDTMYSLMASTRDRAGFTLRSKAYFSQYWRLHAAAGQGQLFFASLGGQVLAGVFATYLGSKAWYKDGGSTKEHAAVMAPHLLQWEVMRWLKARGVEAYDLVAVPPAGELTPAHPLFGPVSYTHLDVYKRQETHHPAGWNLDRLAGARVATEARCALRGLEVAEAVDANFVALFQRLRDRVEEPAHLVACGGDGDFCTICELLCEHIACDDCGHSFSPRV